MSGMINNDTVIVNSTCDNRCPNTPELSLWVRAEHVRVNLWNLPNYPFIGESAQV